MNTYKKTYKRFLLLLFVTLSLLLTSCTLIEELSQVLDILVEDEAPVPHGEGEVVVHFIDVGQGDSMLIEMPTGENMLIDGGDRDKGQVVADYLKKQGVERVDFLVATHPHADHIGGLKGVIEEFDIGDIYMPRATHTSNTYINLLKAIEKKGLKIKAAEAGMEIPVKEAKAQILAPDKNVESDNHNDYSIVIRLSYGKTAFIFQGDAEKKTENTILDSGVKIKSDVIKLGHHGSTTSNIPEYIGAVSPKYAVITLGKDNKYGHPHKEILELMDKEKIQVLRTDIDGDIVIKSDGEKVWVVK